MNTLIEVLRKASERSAEYCVMLGWLLSQVESGDIQGAQKSAAIWKQFREEQDHERL